MRREPGLKYVAVLVDWETGASRHVSGPLAQRHLAEEVASQSAERARERVAPAVAVRSHNGADDGMHYLVTGVYDALTYDEAHYPAVMAEMRAQGIYE